jgi:hypothetical protein
MMDQIRYIAFVTYLKKWAYTGAEYLVFRDFKIAYDSVRREVLYNILVQISIHMK